MSNLNQDVAETVVLSDEYCAKIKAWPRGCSRERFLDSCASFKDAYEIAGSKTLWWALTDIFGPVEPVELFKSKYPEQTVPGIVASFDFTEEYGTMLREMYPWEVVKSKLIELGVNGIE